MPADSAIPDLFSELPADYPKGKFKPLHKLFAGTAKVHRNGGEGAYYVDLTQGECSCASGQAFAWEYREQKWEPNSYCAHKIKVLAAIVTSADEDLYWPYCKALATRYNRYEVVSAFHKELRRGDEHAAVFWGSMVSVYRGLKGVLKYLISIMYEETRDHTLLTTLVALIKSDTKPSYANVCQAIVAFCRAKKKWQLSYRMQVFEAEMRAYGKLCDTYGDSVAQPANIIKHDQKGVLVDAMKQGFTKGDRAQFQYGLKGLQKLWAGEGPAFQRHRVWLLDTLHEIWIEHGHDVNPAPTYLHGVIHEKADIDGIHYHEINAFADLMIGEPWDYGCSSPKALRMILNNPKHNKIVLGKFPAIPLYAHDNHTWMGKGLMRRYPGELTPKADQSNLDFRWCGAYMGVSWRMLAYTQHQNCDVPWGDVEWPAWLYRTTKRLFY